MKRFKREDGTDFPEWGSASLGELVSVVYGDRITKKESSGTIYPVYGGGGCSFFTDKFNQTDTLVVSRFAISKNCVRYESGSFWLLDSALTLIPNEGINKKFLFYKLKSMQKDIYKTAHGITQKNVQVKDLLALKIEFPCIEEQNKIADFLTELDKRIGLEKQLVEQLVEQLLLKHLKDLPAYGQALTWCFHDSYDLLD